MQTMHSSNMACDAHPVTFSPTFSECRHIHYHNNTATLTKTCENNIVNLLGIIYLLTSYPYEVIPQELEQ